MKRRDFAALLALGLLARPAFGQRAPANIPRVGFLSVAPMSGMQVQLEGLRAGLRDLGYVEGRDIRFEFRSAEGKYERLPQLATELVGLKVDLIVTAGTPPTRAAKAATTTISIVMIGAGDPVASGLVASLARPGGNVTGSSNISPVLMVKRLELLKEAHPGVRTVGALLNPANPAQRLSFEAMAAAAESLRVEVLKFEARNLAEIKEAFAAMAKQRVEALAVANDPVLIANARAIAEFAAKQRLMSSGNREFAESGGLLGYGSITEVFRHSATYIDRILKGAKPADIPVEQPTNVELVVNLRTAKAMGLSMPQRMLVRAGRVIE
jgi:putative ABC transport system substrate-binding protein